MTEADHEKLNNDVERAIAYLRKHEWSIWIAVLSVLGRSASLYPCNTEGDASAKELAMKYLAALKSDPESDPAPVAPRPKPQQSVMSMKCFTCGRLWEREYPGGPLSPKCMCLRVTRPNPEYDVQGLVAGLMAVRQLIENSRGVAGLWNDGDEAPWEQLRADGEYEGWLLHFDKAMEQIEGQVNGR